MINDLDTLLERLIYTNGKIPRGDVDVAFDQPNRDWSARVSRPTLNLWAFDLRENVKLRPNPRQINPGNDNHVNITNPPMRFDISYWVSSWARKIEDEHQLLWRGLAALRKVPFIRPRDAEGVLKYSTIDIPLRVGDMTAQQFNVSDLWGVLDNSMRLGFMLVVTLELDLEYVIDTPLVLEKTLRFGQSDAPAEQRLSTLDTEFIQKGAANDNKSSS